MAPESPPNGKGLDRANLLWFLALFCLVLFLIFEPYLGFALFGSDSGEYYRLTSGLIASAHLVPSAGYAGWGFAYPEFPGIFLISAAAAGGLGVDVLSSVLFVVPFLAAFALFPLFLLFRRLFDHDTVALLGAAFATVALPRLFSVAHPAPLALGDLFVVGALWAFIEGRKDPRWYLPLALTAGALIVTHHLSSYFFLVSALGGLLLFEMFRPGGWSRRFPLRELLFLAGFATALLLYWFVYASAFRSHIVSQGLPGSGGTELPLFLLGAIVGVALCGLLIRSRRAHPRRAWRVRLPSDRNVLRDALLILSALAIGTVVLLFFPLPGTSGQHATPATIAFFSPYMAVVVLAAGSRHHLTTGRLGPFAAAWLGALGLSTIFALVTNNTVLLPSRAAEYLVIPLGLLVAVSLGRWVARAADRGGRRGGAVAVALVLALLGANAAIVQPPPQYFNGFQEGLTEQDAALWMWAGPSLPAGAAVASDHRLSSMLFGFDGLPATWDSTPSLFVGTNWSLAAAELAGSPAPRSILPIRAVAVDATMHEGVALDPGAFAEPMTPQAAAWLNAPPFLPLYENGEQAVYWVDGPP